VAYKALVIRTYISTAMSCGMEVYWPCTSNEHSALQKLNDVLVRAMRIAIRIGYCPDSIRLRSCTKPDTLHRDMNVPKMSAANVAAQLRFHAKCSKRAAAATADGPPPPLSPLRLPEDHPWQKRMRTVYTLVRHHVPSLQAQPAEVPSLTTTFGTDCTNRMINCTVAAWQAQEARNRHQPSMMVTRNVQRASARPRAVLDLFSTVYTAPEELKVAYYIYAPAKVVLPLLALRSGHLLTDHHEPLYADKTSLTCPHCRCKVAGKLDPDEASIPWVRIWHELVACKQYPLRREALTTLHVAVLRMHHQAADWADRAAALVMRVRSSDELLPLALAHEFLEVLLRPLHTLQPPQEVQADVLAIVASFLDLAIARPEDLMHVSHDDTSEDEVDFADTIAARNIRADPTHAHAAHFIQTCQGVTLATVPPLRVRRGVCCQCLVANAFTGGLIRNCIIITQRVPHIPRRHETLSDCQHARHTGNG
jgi:hypothetical protein